MNGQELTTSRSLNRTFQLMLIEDNQGDIDLTKEALKVSKNFIQLKVFLDGIAAMNFLNEQTQASPEMLPDLILLDLNLPRKDGRQILSEMKADRHLKSIPVIVFTSSDAEIDIFKSYQLGANCYVVKPTGFKAYKKIVEVLDDFWINTVHLPPKETLSFLRSHGLQTKSPPQLDAVHMLIIEDNPADAEFLKIYLTKQTSIKFIIKQVDRLRDGLEHMKSNPTDIVITDLGLPDAKGEEAILRISEQFPEMPIVVLTGEDDEEVALRAIRTKVQDFLVKGKVTPTFLPRIIQYALKRKEEELEKAQLIAREQAARAEAENAVLLREEFLSIASHELRTPISSLKLQINMLQRYMARTKLEDIPIDKFNELLQKANIQIDRFTNLINTFLDISMIQSGKLIIHRNPMDLKEMTENIVSLFQDSFQSEGSILNIYCQHNIQGNWDHERLEQVLINLLSNAKKYAPNAPIDIYLYIEGNSAVLAVQDHGPGIPEDIQEKIFKRFERGTAPKSIGGLGLGLYISRQIIDLHGGSITLESKMGEGARFIVRLPLN